MLISVSEPSVPRAPPHLTLYNRALMFGDVDELTLLVLLEVVADGIAPSFCKNNRAENLELTSSRFRDKAKTWKIDFKTCGCYLYTSTNAI